MSIAISNVNRSISNMNSLNLLDLGILKQDSSPLSGWRDNYEPLLHSFPIKNAKKENFRKFISQNKKSQERTTFINTSSTSLPGSQLKPDKTGPITNITSDAYDLARMRTGKKAEQKRRPQSQSNIENFHIREILETKSKKLIRNIANGRSDMKTTELKPTFKEVNFYKTSKPRNCSISNLKARFIRPCSKLEKIEKKRSCSLESSSLFSEREEQTIPKDYKFGGAFQDECERIVIKNNEKIQARSYETSLLQSEKEKIRMRNEYSSLYNDYQANRNEELPRECVRLFTTKINFVRKKFQGASKFIEHEEVLQERSVSSRGLVTNFAFAKDKSVKPNELNGKIRSKSQPKLLSDRLGQGFRGTNINGTSQIRFFSHRRSSCGQERGRDTETVTIFIKKLEFEKPGSFFQEQTSNSKLKLMGNKIELMPKILPGVERNFLSKYNF